MIRFNEEGPKMRSRIIMIREPNKGCIKAKRILITDENRLWCQLSLDSSLFLKLVYYVYVSFDLFPVPYHQLPRL
jgi:hypothetical protein